MSQKRPTPSSKISGIKSSTPSSGRRPNMNATLLSTGPSSRCRTNLNSTLCTPKMLPSMAIPEDDTDLEMEFAYNTYLQDLLKKQILSKSIEEHKIKCNDQLEVYRNSLEKYKKEEISLKAELEEKQNIIDLERDIKELEAELQGNEDCLNASTKAQSESLVQLLTAEHNKLYLKNVEVLNSEDEYKHLENLIGECCKKLEKFQSLIGDSNGLKELTNCLNANIRLQEDIVSKNKTVQNVAETATNLALETVSDLLVNNT